MTEAPHALRSLGPRNRPARVKRCATCLINFDARTHDGRAGACQECLDRSRVMAEDDLGGEA